MICNNNNNKNITLKMGQDRNLGWAFPPNLLPIWQLGLQPKSQAGTAKPKQAVVGVIRRYLVGLWEGRRMDSYSSHTGAGSSASASPEALMEGLKAQLAQAYAESFLEVPPLFLLFLRVYVIYS